MDKSTETQEGMDLIKNEVYGKINQYIWGCGQKLGIDIIPGGAACFHVRKKLANFRKGEGIMKAKITNPIIKSIYTADPAPMVVGDTLYLYTT